MLLHEKPQPQLAKIVETKLRGKAFPWRAKKSQERIPLLTTTTVTKGPIEGELIIGSNTSIENRIRFGLWLANH